MNNGQLSGIGIAPEGIENNPVIYDLMAEMAWRDKTVDIEKWITQYSQRRYGYDSDALNKAWQIMARTVYTGPSSYIPLESEICARPSLNIRKVSSNGSTEMYYDPAELAPAWLLFLKEHEHLRALPTYQYDLVDLSRQVLVDYGRDLYQQMVQAVKKGQADVLEQAGQKFLTLILDIDRLLATNEYFLFGKWLEDARKKGTNPVEKKLFEWNATTQVTLWSSPEITEFHDYANKQWAGLLEGYYYKRWEMFIGSMLQSMKKDQLFDEKRFVKQTLEWEARWPFFGHNYPSQPEGDSVAVALELFEKYWPVISRQKEKLKLKEVLSY